eukprot:1191476-Prorocentrum_minimum.AAC.4
MSSRFPPKLLERELSSITIGRICARQGIGTGGNTKERREGKLDPPACTLWRLGAQLDEVIDDLRAYCTSYLLAQKLCKVAYFVLATSTKWTK